MGNLVIVVDLHVAKAWARIDHMTHADSGGLEPGALRPVGDPQEIGRIDIGRQALVVAVQLVRSDEMHLARQDRSVARCSEIVRDRWNLGTELGRVVIHAERVRQATGQHRCARGGADRKIAVRLIEDRGLRSQGREGRGLNNWMTVERQPVRGQLVCHQ